MTTESISTLVPSTNAGRYALDDPVSGPDVTSGQPLAVLLGGYWVDVKPTEIGYWAMVVPPGTRTWPFGRIVRFISMGHREKDLVSYYLELASRGRAQR